MQEAAAIVVSLIIKSAVVNMWTASEESFADWRLFSCIWTPEVGGTSDSSWS
jgi:hypothetical protein